MGSYRLIEHTADMGLEASGESRAELYLQAALALREILATTGGSPLEEREVEVKGGDAAELMVKWLNEILFLLETKGFFPVFFRIEEVTAEMLRARVIGEPFDPDRHSVEREVKAATYHQLRVEQSDGVWHARIFVDL
jgi:SHS2 domain-containing protein